MGLTVIDGDQSDFRPYDPGACVVGQQETQPGHVEHPRVSCGVLGGRHSIHSCQLVGKQVNQRGFGREKRIEEVGVLDTIRLSDQRHEIWIRAKDSTAFM